MTWNRVRAVLLILALIAVVAGGLAGCGKDIDPRYENANKTFTTLLRAYGVASISEGDVAERMTSGAKFTLHHESDFREAFIDYRSPADEGAAGFVFGRLARNKDSLVFDTKGDRTDIYIKNRPRTQVAAVMMRDKESGAWKFSIKESVPAEIRARLLDLYRRAEDAKRAAHAH